LHSQTEAGPTLHHQRAPVGSVEKLEQTWHHLVFRFGMTQTTVATKTPAEDALLRVHSKLMESTEKQNK
jgi:hypothetical protein